MAANRKPMIRCRWTFAKSPAKDYCRRVITLAGKPRGMQWRTYNHLKSQHEALVQISLCYIGNKLGFLNKVLEG